MTHFWIAAALISVLSLGIRRAQYRPRRPQHAGAGAGATTVWQLREQVEAEHYRGRHRLREPAPRPPVEFPAHDEELLRKLLRGLESL
ncbi:hypothetical protein [Saccharopolyspora rosea]|uniref:Uncharacterized protein n=1 Tax=Saccharopolyspora rosea TaxID=524884 RepID=A0ABW3FMQ5_9PSEU|nr:hypothetical protein [Saccharopolyspora rosea]